MKLQLHAYRICVIYFLVSQGFVHATLLVIDSLNRTVDNFNIREATVIDGVLEGYIEYANPSDACTEISLPKFPQNFTMKKIVLINGTATCNLLTKVENAEQAGYDVAVLFDPFPGLFDYNTTFPLSISQVNLSVVLVLAEDGIMIRDYYLYNISDKDHFKIRIHANLAQWINDLIIFVCTMCILVVTVVLLYIIIHVLMCIWRSCADLCGNRPAEQQNVNRNDPLLRALMNVINEQYGIQRNEEEYRTALSNLRRRCPSIVFSTDHPFEVCVICTNNFEVEDKIRVLPCRHAYHTDCIDKWLLHSKETCPMCVARVNLENSCDHSLRDPTERTPLIASAQGLYSSSSRTGDGSGPSNAAYGNPLRSTDESGELLAEAQGSVNYVPLNNEDQQGLMV